MPLEMFLREFASLASGPGGVQKLREMVLQLAVRGKLVPQLAEDDDAKTILTGIENEPDPAVKKRIAKYPTPDPLYQTPVNWVWTAIGKVSRDWGQKVPDKPFQYIDVGGIDNRKGEISPNLELTQPENAPSRARKIISRGTVLYSTVRPYLRNIAVVDREFETEAIASTAFAIVHPLGGIIPEFVFYYLRSPDFVAYVEGQMMGVAYPAINDAKFFAAPIPLPPLAEQNRIVAKVDELMALCDTLEARQVEEAELKRAAAASALHHLTETQTAQESADRWSLLAPRFGDLFDDLETIKGLKTAIADAAVNGEFSAPSERTHFAPTTVNDVLISSNSGWSPRCDNIPATEGDWGVLKVSAVTWGVFKPEENKRLPSDMEPRPQHALRTGDILVSRANTAELVGRGVKVPEDYPHLMLSDKIVRLVLSEAIEPDYFLLAFHASPIRAYFAKVATGTSDSMRNITRDHIKAAPIIIPRLDEQKRIVAKVRELMALCDQLEEEVREGERLNAELMASLLHTLTETDPGGGGGVASVGLHEAASGAATTKHVDRETPERPETKSMFIPLRPEPEAQSAPNRVLSVDTKFQEAVLVAAIVRTFFKSGGEPIGNFRLQKAVYFARRRMGEHVDEMAYLKKAAGPYNPSMKYSGGIAIAKQKNWLREARGRFGFGHVPGPDVGEAGVWIETYSYDAPARWVAEHFRYKKNEEWETLATVDYAIEHLQAHGIEPDAAQILQYISSDSEWRPKIEKLGLTEMSVGTAMLEVKALFNAQSEGGAA